MRSIPVDSPANRILYRKIGRVYPASNELTPESKNPENSRPVYIEARRWNSTSTPATFRFLDEPALNNEPIDYLYKLRRNTTLLIAPNLSPEECMKRHVKRKQGYEFNGGLLIEEAPNITILTLEKPYVLGYVQDTVDSRMNPTLLENPTHLDLTEYRNEMRLLNNRLYRDGKSCFGDLRDRGKAKTI
ncbi:MAG: hypothetical protein JW727_04145 [Candidatus Aenigmarchaeota archaeon]|nr:hypothetical protein [Candidatus Aenigmarchaeota archaeon]